MKRLISLPLLVLFGGTAALVRADQADDAIVAAMKLSAAVDYTWTATITQNSHALSMNGKTTPDSYSLVTFTGYSAGSGVSTAKPGGVNTVFLGDSKYVVENAGNWTLATDTSSSSSTPASSSSSSNNSSTSSTRGGRTRVGGGTGTSAQRRRTDPDASPTANAPKLPSGVNMPHEELAIIAANYDGPMQSKDGVVTGKLTEWGADLLLEPPGWMQAPPDKAAGTFSLWIKDGAVTKYELKLTADTGPGGTTIKGGLSKTSTVELTDVGATTFDVPPLAKHKLGV